MLSLRSLVGVRVPLLADPPGIGIGVSAALMAIITGWLSDIKLGHCSTGWWLGRKFCCIEISEDGGCDEWHDWGAIPPFPWLVYITYAVGVPRGMHVNTH